LGLATVLRHLDGLRLVQVALVSDRIVLEVAASRSGARCPSCGQRSRRVHSRYVRRLADEPIGGRRVAIRFSVRRFRCTRRTCARRTFAEQAPTLAARSARRTVSLDGHLRGIGVTLGGRPGARFAARRAIRTSRTTLIRLVRGMPAPAVTTPTVLGVDDFALRRGHRYGTILVDAEARRVVDLLEDPSAEALVAWLADHAGVERICRDRDGVYAGAASRGAPGARQIADRWHLAHNLAEAMERFAGRALTALRATEEEATGAPQPTAPFTPPPALGRLAARTEQRHAAVQALLAEGLTVAAVARRLGLDWRTARKFAGAPTAAPLVRACRYRTTLDPFVPYLAQRWGEGQHVAAALFGELRARGYRGSERTVRAYLARWRAAAPPPAAEVGLPRPRTLAGLLLRRPATLDERTEQLLDDLGRRSPELAAARRLAQGFLRLVRERRGDELAAWVADVDGTGPTELRAFSRNLQRDWNAVTAGLTERRSSGPVEGHVNKLKLVKRQMYGRAKFDLLRRRVLLAS
jgi:transposase